MMESPQMYDQNSNALDVKKIVNNNNGHHHPTARLVASKSSCLFSDDSAELADLNTPEISLDLQGLIDESHFSEGIFREIDLLEGKHGKVDIPSTSANSVSLPSVTQLQQPSAPSYTNRGALTYMTQHIHSAATFPSEQTLAPPIKKEPNEEADFNSCNRPGLAPLSAGGPIFNRNMNGSYTNAVQLPSGYTPYTPATLQRGTASPMKQESPSLSRSSSANSHSSKNKKLMDKHSDEYRRRRERNNIAVRKSREKAKLRTREIEERVKILTRENERLQKRVELLTKELNVLRSLFSNVGILPDQLQREIAKQLETGHPAMGL